jgi:hypothetical protein
MSDQFSTFLCPAVEPCASWTGGWNAELLYTSLFVSSSHGLPNICRDRMRNQKNFSVSNRLVRGPGKEVRLHPTLTSMLFAVRVFQTVVLLEYRFRPEGSEIIGLSSKFMSSEFRSSSKLFEGVPCPLVFPF